MDNNPKEQNKDRTIVAETFEGPNRNLPILQRC